MSLAKWESPSTSTGSIPNDGADFAAPADLRSTKLRSVVTTALSWLASNQIVAPAVAGDRGALGGDQGYRVRERCEVSCRLRSSELQRRRGQEIGGALIDQRDHPSQYGLRVVSVGDVVGVDIGHAGGAGTHSQADGCRGCKGPSP